VSATKGRGWLLKVDKGSANFVTIGGMQKISYATKNDQVDITNADSDGIGTLLENAGTQSRTLQLDGIYLDDDVDGQGTLEQAADDNTFVTLQLVRPGTERNLVIQGTFAVTDFQYDAESKDAGKTSVKFQSSGPVTRS
jgi:predicted secreted protein